MSIITVFFLPPLVNQRKRVSPKIEKSNSDKLDRDRQCLPHQSTYLLVWMDWNTIHPINHILFFNSSLGLTNEWSVKTGGNYIFEYEKFKWEIFQKFTVKKQRGGRDDPWEGGGCCGRENGRAAPQDFPTRFFYSQNFRVFPLCCNWFVSLVENLIKWEWIEKVVGDRENDPLADDLCLGSGDPPCFLRWFQDNKVKERLQNLSN